MIDLSIVDVLEDPEVFGRAFGRVNAVPAELALANTTPVDPVDLDFETWANWIVVLRGLFALPMTKSERRTFKELTGRAKAPRAPVREFHGIAGRRSGKSRIVALIAVFLACFVPYRKHLAPGERASILILAQDRKAARTIFGYVRGLIRECRMLERLVESETRESITLTNSVEIAIQTASFRSVRSYTCAAILCDEVAFWMDADSGANPAQEILASLRPSLATIPTSMLMCISSPYRRSGPSFEAYRDHFGQDDDNVLVIKAASQTMNPTLDADFIKQEFERDPARAASEWSAEWRSDLAAFLDDELIEAAIDRDRPMDLPPAGHTYRAFVDPSGGRGDSFTLSIAHREDDAVIVDLIRGRKPPFSPQNVVSEFATILRAYGLSSVCGDRYSAEWVVSSFRDNGIYYEASPKAKSDLYLESLPLWTQGRVRMPDAKVTIAELRGLERRTGRSGRDSVDHPQAGHDDLANALCGCLWLLGEAPVALTGDMFWASGDTLGAQLMELAADGYSASEARMLAGSDQREDFSGALGPFIV